jgi:hypothetical protein
MPALRNLWLVALVLALAFRPLFGGTGDTGGGGGGGITILPTVWQPEGQLTLREQHTIADYRNGIRLSIVSSGPCAVMLDVGDYSGPNPLVVEGGRLTLPGDHLVAMKSAGVSSLWIRVLTQESLVANIEIVLAADYQALVRVY